MIVNMAIFGKFGLYVTISLRMILKSYLFLLLFKLCLPFFVYFVRLQSNDKEALGADDSPKSMRSRT